MPDNGNPGAGALAALFAALFAGGAIGVVRGIGNAGSKAARAVAPYSKAMLPVSIADNIALSATPDSLATAKLLRQPADDFSEVFAGASISDDIDRSSISRTQNSSASDEVIEEPSSHFEIPEPVKSLFEDAGKTGIEELLGQINGDDDSATSELREIDAERLDDFIFSDAFLGRNTSYIDAGRFADAANVQRAVVRTTARLAEADAEYLPALSYALASHTWTAMLDGKPAEAVEAAELLASIKPENRANLDMRIALLNWAHAQMFLGNEQEAIDTYVSFVDGDFGSGHDWRSIISDDFATLRRAGLESPDMEFVLAIIGPSTDAAP